MTGSVWIYGRPDTGTDARICCAGRGRTTVGIETAQNAVALLPDFTHTNDIVSKQARAARAGKAGLLAVVEGMTVETWKADRARLIKMIGGCGVTVKDNVNETIVSADEITCAGGNKERRKKALMAQVTAEAKKRVEERKRQGEGLTGPGGGATARNDRG